MSQKLTIVARIEANADKVELVKTELLKLVAPTLKETGCIQYDLPEKLGPKPRPFRTAFFVVAKFWLLMLS